MHELWLVHFFLVSNIQLSVRSIYFIAAVNVVETRYLKGTRLYLWLGSPMVRANKASGQNVLFVRYLPEGKAKTERGLKSYIFQPVDAFNNRRKEKFT